MAISSLILIYYSWTPAKWIDSMSDDHHINVILTASLVRGSYIFMEILCCSAILAERYLASHYIRDYEKNSRYHISVIIISILFISCISLATSRSFYIVGSIVDYSFMFGSQILNVYLYLKELYLHRRRKNLLVQPGYDLSTRFQINENFRVITLLQNLLVGVLFSVPFVLSCVLLRRCISDVIVLTVVNNLLELSISGLPLLIYFIVTATIKELRRFAVSFFCGQSESVNSGLELAAGDTTTAYFTQFQSAWN